MHWKLLHYTFSHPLVEWSNEWSVQLWSNSLWLTTQPISPSWPRFTSTSVRWLHLKRLYDQVQCVPIPNLARDGSRVVVWQNGKCITLWMTVLWQDFLAILRLCISPGMTRSVGKANSANDKKKTEVSLISLCLFANPPSYAKQTFLCSLTSYPVCLPWSVYTPSAVSTGS